MKKFSLLFIAAIFTLSFLFFAPVSALPNERIIVANCANAQRIIEQMEKTDTVTRINRGRAYNEILDLLFAMNARLSSNKISAPEMNAITDEIAAKTDEWRTDYDQYDENLGEIVALNCAAEPVKFYEKLESARHFRGMLFAKIREIDAALARYNENLTFVAEENQIGAQ